MSYLDWHSGVIVSSAKRHTGFVCMSTVDDLSYTPSAEEKSRDAAQFVATGRRSWKTLKGKGEAVWPPLLEAALIEALERYQPESSRPPKTLGRFPMRNRFISDYIFETTGKRRTPKQVGSRLQQMRDTCKGERILQLISRRHPTDSDSGTGSSSNASDYSRSASLTPPREMLDQVNCLPTVVYIDIILEQLSWSVPRPVIHLIDNERDSPLRVHLSTLSHDSQVDCGDGDLTPTHTTRSLPTLMHGLDPAATFVSPCALALQTTYSVYIDDHGDPLHTEVVPLTCQSSPMQSAGWLYSATIVPGFWRKLTDSTNPVQYTIIQTFTPIRQNEAEFFRKPAPNMSISVVYRFKTIQETFEPAHLASMNSEHHHAGFQGSMAYPDSHTFEETLPYNNSQHWPSTSASNLDWNNHGVSTFRSESTPHAIPRALATARPSPLYPTHYSPHPPLSPRPRRHKQEMQFDESGHGITPFVPTEMNSWRSGYPLAPTSHPFHYAAYSSS